MSLSPKSVLLNRIICIVLITICFLQTIWLDIALLKMNIRFSDYAKGSDILFFRVACWKTVFLLAYTGTCFILIIWSILKNKPLLLLGSSIFFLFETIHCLNLLFGAFFNGLEFFSILILLVLLLVNAGIVFFLVRIIKNLNHPLIDLNLFRKRKIQTTNKNQHLFVVIFLILGFPYLYDLVNHFSSIYNQSGYRIYTNNYIYLAILISYLIAIAFQNRFIHLTFTAIIVFTISEFHEFLFNLILSVINYQNENNQSGIFSFATILIYKIFAHIVMISMIIAAKPKLRNYFYSRKPENEIILDSEFETME